MKYRVTATVTVSALAYVEASSDEDAFLLANLLDMPELCYKCGTKQDDGTWVVSAIDGEAQDVMAEPV